MEFNEVLMTIESMTSHYRFSNAAMIGLTSKFFVMNLGETSERYITNERTLPSKEDVIFAALLIQAGKDVIIDRYCHFKDYPFTVGGCIHNSPDEETPTQEVEQLNIGN